MPSLREIIVVMAFMVLCAVALVLVANAGDKTGVLVDAEPLLVQRSDADTMKLIPDPPLRFQGNATATVHFTDPATIWELCGKAVEGKVVKGKVLLGCATTNPPQMAILNPCPFKDEELWAREACHEKAHRLGWTEKHEAKSDLAIPHEDMLFSPCPLAPRNVPRLQRRIA